MRFAAVTITTLSSLAAVATTVACSSDDRAFTRIDGGTSVPDGGFVAVEGNDGAAPAPGGEVFGHSDTTLYRLDPDTKQVKVIGNFVGCDEKILDIALDEKSVMYGAGTTTLYRIDRTTAQCATLRTLNEGEYPNSLSFVPAGTVDPKGEALVGFVDAIYYRIDTSTGVKTSVGSLGTVYKSSGDIVSVKGGGTYLTIKNDGCNDCLVQIDPKNGSIIKNFGPLNYTDVFGLTFWGGSAYGFTKAGELFEVKFVQSGVGTTAIPIPQAPSGLSFWGAGSTTSAPLAPIR